MIKGKRPAGQGSHFQRTEEKRKANEEKRKATNKLKSMIANFEQANNRLPNKSELSFCQNQQTLP